MRFRTKWRWSEVDGKYLKGEPPEREQTGEISVNRAFSNKTILLLGGTGFVGKVLLAMILERLPELKHLVIQTRRKRNVSGEERFYSEVLLSPPLRKVVERIGQETVRQKVQIVEGDIDKPLCGLHSEQIARLKGQVDIVVNLAGVVDFSPPVTESFKTNVYGTRNVIDLVQLLGAKLAHVSTSYVAGKKNGRISEDIPIDGYCPMPHGRPGETFSLAGELKWYEQFVKDARENADRDPRPLRGRLRDGGTERAESWGWTNTYTYTKSLGEQLIAQTPGLTYAIVRPAIVESSMEYPFPGWNEGLTTSAPLVLMGAEGMKDWPVKDGPLEIIPVDMVAAGILIVTAAVLCGKNEHVYQLASADQNAIVLPRLVAFLGMNSRYKHKSKKSGSRLANLWKAYVETRIVPVQMLEARRARLHRHLDLIHSALTLGQKFLGTENVGPLLKNFRDIRRQIRAREITLDQFRPFLCDNIYIFETRNIQKAARMLQPEDLTRLRWDPETIDWADYWVNIHTKGIERWIRPTFTSRKNESE
jgi:long-chain acyl-CoA synthetase